MILSRPLRLALLVILSMFILSAGVFAKYDDPVEDPIDPIPGDEPLCGTGYDSSFYVQEVDQINNNQQMYGSSPDRSEPHYIGVAFHIVRNDDGSGGILESVVWEHFDLLNEFFEPGGIVFFPLTDIEYIDNTEYNSDETSLPGMRQLYDVPNAINVYYTYAIDYGLGGYTSGVGSNATYVMMNSRWVNTYKKVLTHEAGHVLYLYHTHQRGDECADGSNCDVAGDLVCDTPADPVLGSHNVDANCNYYGNEVPPCGGSYYSPDTENHMSYSLHRCRDHFSAGQFDRMEYYLVNYLSRILYDIPHAFYVDANIGNDNNFGTENYPYASITYAATQVDDGDTILVAPGTYAGGISVDKDVAILSTAGPNQTIITSGAYTNLVEFHDITANIATLDGFHLKVGKIGVWCENSDPTISHCVLDSQQTGIWAAITLSSDYAADLGTSPAKIINNTIVNCRHSGILNNSNTAPVIKNNIVYKNRYGLFQGTGAAAPDNDYNDVFWNPEYPWYPPVDSNYMGNISAGPNSISADPFMSDDFRLYIGSPCLDAGDPDPEFNDPDNSRNDIGAIPGEIDIQPTEILYVDDDGCTGCYTTISDAVLAADDYSEIRVYPGTYAEGIDFNGKTIRLVSTDGPEVTFIEAGNWGWAVNLESGERPWTEISGFTFTTYLAYNIIQLGSSSSIKISNCIFPDNQYSTTYYDHHIISIGAYHNGEIIIERNLFYNNTMQGCIRVRYGADPVLIINNTFDDNYAGIYSSSGQTVCKNNIITNNAAFGVKNAFGELDYNDIWNNGTDYESGAVAGPNSISLDPLFVNPGNRDYHITFSSPCKDAGDPDTQYNDPDGSRNDMGVYPYEFKKPVFDPPIEPKADAGSALPQKYELSQNHPNPFNPSTEINFSLPNSGHVEIEVYNILGRKVKTLVDGHMDAGYQTVIWDGTTSSGETASSGIYFYRLSTADFIETKKMSLIK